MELVEIVRIAEFVSLQTNFILNTLEIRYFKSWNSVQKLNFFEKITKCVVNFYSGSVRFNGPGLYITGGARDGVGGSSQGRRRCPGQHISYDYTHGLYLYSDWLVYTLDYYWSYQEIEYFWPSDSIIQ